MQKQYLHQAKGIKVKTIKVEEATPIQLNWLVAKCEGLKCDVPAYADRPWVRVTDPCGLQYVCPDYSTNWAHGGPLKVKKKIVSGPSIDGRFFAFIPTPHKQEKTPSSFGDTELIAAMRCVVVSHYGKEVEVPNSLI